MADDADLRLDRIMDPTIAEFGYMDVIMYLQTRAWVRSKKVGDAWDQVAEKIEETMELIPEKSRFIEGDVLGCGGHDAHSLEDLAEAMKGDKQK